MPTDYRESTVYTKLPNGEEMKLRIRREEAEQVRKLEATEDVYILENPEKLEEFLNEWLNKTKM